MAMDGARLSERVVAKASLGCVDRLLALVPQQTGQRSGPQQTRLELRPSRAQSRWLLDLAQRRLVEPDLRLPRSAHPGWPLVRAIAASTVLVAALALFAASAMPAPDVRQLASAWRNRTARRPPRRSPVRRPAPRRQRRSRRPRRPRGRRPARHRRPRRAHQRGVRGIGVDPTVVTCTINQCADVTIRSNGEADLELREIRVDDDLPSDQFRITGGCEEKTLAPGEYCTLAFKWTPEPGQQAGDRPADHQPEPAGSESDRGHVARHSREPGHLRCRMSLDGERPRRACGYGHSRTSRFGRCRRSSHAHRARCASRRSRDSEGAAAPRQGHRELHGRGAHDKRAKGDRRSRSRSAGDGDGGDRQSADPRCESLAAEVKKQRRSAMSEGLNRFVPAIRTRHLAAAVALRREQRAKGRVGGAWRFRRLAVSSQPVVDAADGGWSPIAVWQRWWL